MQKLRAPVFIHTGTPRNDKTEKLKIIIFSPLKIAFIDQKFENLIILFIDYPLY